MRKLGLVLVLLFTLSIVSATDFTLSGKITPKAGVTALVDGDYPAAFTFSDGTSYNGQVTMTNGVFVADFSGMTNAESAIANSDTVTMGISALGGTQTFSNIPLTTVPKAAVANAAHLSTPKSGSETSHPQLEIKYSGDTTTTDSGRYWHFRSGGSAIPTVFSYYGNKQLELNRELATFYGDLNVLGITKLSNRIYQDTGTTDDNYDIWIQGSKTIASSSDHNRNLALLGQAKTDTLYLNYNGEYESGTIIGSATAPTSVLGTLSAGATTLGATTTETLTNSNYLTLKDYDNDGTHSRLYSRDEVLVSQGNAQVTGDLTVTGKLTTGNMEIVEYTLTYDSVEEFKPTTGADTLCDHDRYTCKSLGNTPDFCALSGMAVDGNYDNDDPKFFKAGELSYNSCEVVLRDNGYWILQAYTAGDNDYVQCRARCLAF